MVLRRLIDRTGYKIVHETRTPTDIIPPGFEVVIFTPPEGKIWEMLSCNFAASAIPGATIGTHEFEVIVSNMGYLLGSSGYNKDLAYGAGEWELATVFALPSDKVSQLEILKTIKIDADKPLTIRYDNSTNANQTIPRILRFSFKEVAAHE